MAKFSVGQRVKIICERSINFGKECTIWSTAENIKLSLFPFGEEEDRIVPFVYRVDIEGMGRVHPTTGRKWSYLESDLAPLLPPKDEAWEAFKTLVCTPNPVLANEKV